MEREDILFGQIAVGLNLLTKEQVGELLELKQQQPMMQLGEICLMNGFLKHNEIQRVLDHQRMRGAKPEHREPAPKADPPAGPRPPSRPVREEHAPARSEARAGAARLDPLLRQMVALKASDLHLCTETVPMVRLHGGMTTLAGAARIDLGAMKELLYEILPAAVREQFEAENDADFAYAIEEVARFRVNYFRDHRGLGAVFRQIPFEILSPQQLGLPPRVLELCGLNKGLVLVTGPTGSGKSTTLATLVDHINQTRDLHIITIEDPIEFVHPNKRCLINQREVGAHTQSFKRALRAALREDPDIVLVGEMRDLETVLIALETAETGHLVFATLHTNSAASTIDRIIDQFPHEQQAQVRAMLADTLRGVVAQMLCKRKGGGRVAAYEVLLYTPAVANLIREAKTFQLPSVMQTSREAGMQLLNDHLLELVRTGAVEARDAFHLAYDKSTLKAGLSRLGIAM